jgi:hypothetical protein
VSEGKQTPKAPPRPIEIGDGTIQYSDVFNNDYVLEVEVKEDGTVEVYAADHDSSAVVIIHNRDRVALARQLLEGM